MSSPSHATTRASARAHGMSDVRVAQPTRPRLYIGSLRKQYACANSLATDSLSPLPMGAASRMGDDLAWFIAQTFFTTYVERDEPPLTHSLERNHR